jgi:UDP-N-acetyl-D-mannosaminuronic acid transferase (WecB/TagA/CpsF family)
MGLEWLHRLASEPRRLWWRYLSYNTVFVSKSLLDLSQVMWRRCKALLHRRTAR